MKNTQLRRGNKVLHNRIEKTIDCISPGYVILLEDRKGTDDFGQWVDLDEVEFIPLTEEWLLKFGFKIDETYVSEQNPYLDYIKDEVRISMPYFSFEYGDGAFMELNYVYQLQNLYFSLTARELTVA